MRLASYRLSSSPSRPAARSRSSTCSWPGFGQVHLLALLLDVEIAFEVFFVLLALQLRDQRIELAPQLRIVVGRAGDDQRRARFVDQDRVDFVDHRVVQATLHFLVERESHVVAQVVEAELVVLAVGDVGAISLALFFGGLSGHDHADTHAEEAEDATHPLRVATGQVVVDGDHVDALAAERVQVGRQGGDQRLAFAGAHFGNLAFVQRRTTDQLHVEVPHVHHAPAGFADHGECVGAEVIERFALGEALAQHDRLAAQFLVRHRLILRLQRVDDADHGAEALDDALIAAAEDARQKVVEHGFRSLSAARAKARPVRTKGVDYASELWRGCFAFNSAAAGGGVRVRLRQRRCSPELSAPRRGTAPG